MYEIKMNKNQKKFFEMAIDHFGERSTLLMLKECKKFADQAGLILPTTLMQEFCKVKRGWFDLTKSGVEITPKAEVVDESHLNQFMTGAIISDVSVFADIPDVRTPKQKKDDIDRHPPKKFRNPVYVVQNVNDGTIVAVMDSFKTAWPKREIVLHDAGNMTEKAAENRCESHLTVVVQSANSGIFVSISKLDLNG